MKLLRPIAKARVSQYFGDNASTPEAPSKYGYGPKGHPGVDFSAVVGTPVRAGADGKIHLGNQGTTGYGKYVRLDIAGASLYYSHLSKHMLTGTAKAGDIIALSGNSGNSTAPHLHLEVRINKVPVNPIDLLVDEIEVPMVQKISIQAQRIEKWMQDVLLGWGASGVKLIDAPSGEDPFPKLKYKDIRPWTDSWDAELVAKGEEGGREYVRRLANTIRACSYATTVQITCERDCNTNVGLANLCAFSIGAMKELDAQGLPKGVILNCPEGSPHDNAMHDDAVVIWKWQQLMPAILYAQEHGHFVGRNIYWRPPEVGPLDRYHSLGRLKWDASIWEANGADLSKLKVIITELGIDGGVSTSTMPSLPQRGWRNLSNIHDYAVQIGQCEIEMRKLPWISRAYLFVMGFKPPWSGFDIDQPAAKIIEGYLPMDLQQQIGAAIQKIITPCNPKAALMQAAKKRGYNRASDECFEVPGIVAQAFSATDDEFTTQHIAWCYVGYYDEIHWFDMTN